MNEIDRRPFLSSKTDVRESCGHLLLAAAQLLFHSSLLLPLSLLWLIPAGDQPPQVASRLLVVSLCLIFCWQMIPRKSAIYRRLFGKFVSEQILKAYDYTPAKPSATSMIGEIGQHWPLAIVGILMLTIVSGVVDFDRPWSGPGSSNGKSRWVGPMVEWFRINSNTTKSLAWLLGVGSLALFGYRIRCGWIQQTSVLKNDEVQR